MKHIFFAALLMVSAEASATMAESGRRAQIAGIDLITYRSQVKDVVVIVGSLPAGDAMAESGNIALPTLTGMMLDRGTKALDKYAIARQLGDVGAEISFRVGTQSLEIHAKCLKKDLPLVVGLIGAELRSPALGSEEFAKAKQQFIGTMQSSLQNTDARAHEAFARAVFPSGHPNRPHSAAEYIEAAKAARIEDLRAFHAGYYGPAHLTLVLVGDVSRPDAEAAVSKDFAGWSGGRDYVTPLRAAAATAAPREVPVPLADKPSVSVILGQATGMRYRDPDALALRVGTAALGQGFTGRLMGTVRDKEGFTYDIGAGMSEDSIADGVWDISASFAPTLLAGGIAATRRELGKWWQDGITEAELSARKQGLVGGYLVSLSTSAGIAGAILNAVQRGYDIDWLDGYPQAIEALTRAQVNRAIRSHLDPGTMILVEAGSVPAAAH